MPGKISSPIRRIGVLTGGGDVPGLNAAIKALVYRADAMDISVTGLRAGWEGITYLERARGRDALIFRPDGPSTWQGCYLMPLNRLNTRTIDRQGGTILQSTRTNPAKKRVGDLPLHLSAHGIGHGPDDRVDLTNEVLANMSFLELDGLVVIGGDDTLSYGAVLAAKGVPVWGIPKTMDNDVPGTDYCIGFQTAISRAAEFLAEQLSARIEGVRFLPIDLTYFLRSGEPDAYDKHMAIYYANLAMSFVEQGIDGVMAAHREGAFISTDIPGKNFPARRVDPADYHDTRYRPRFEHITGSYRPQG